MRRLSIILLVAGELLAVGCELWFAKQVGKHTPLWHFLVAQIPFLIIGGPLLTLGYYYGVKHWGIWTTSIVSLASIIVIEPILVLLIWQELPNTRECLGAAFTALGIGITLAK